MAMTVKLRRSSGFTLIEVMIAIVVLGVGLLSALALFVTSMSTMQSAQEDLIAREKAKEAFESVVSARDTGEITFDQIQNIATAPGIFNPDPQPLYVPRATTSLAGITNTPDYLAPGGVVESVTLPGKDGILGTADDIQMPLTNFQRQITITPAKDASGGTNPSLRQIVVTVQYNGARVGVIHQYSVTGYVSRYH
jgi:prepilin-type N-terminal cleavage/methylation domain-containing protein